MIQEKNPLRGVSISHLDLPQNTKAWDAAADILSSNRKAEVQRLILLCLEKSLEDNAVPLDIILSTVENTWFLTHHKILSYSEEELKELFFELVRHNLIKEVGVHGYTLTTLGINAVGHILQLSVDSPRSNRH